MASSSLELQTALLRTVSIYVNSKKPHLCKNVVLVLSQLGLAAEEDSGLSGDEVEALAGGVDEFSRKVLEAVAHKNDDEKKASGVNRLAWLVSNSCKRRVVHSLHEWVSVLLDIVKREQGVLELQACTVLSLLFKRLEVMAWVQGVKKVVAPLTSKVLQAMTKNLVDRRGDSNSWLTYGKAIISILRGFPVQQQHVESAAEVIVPKLVMESATDAQRLLSSQFLAAVLSSSKNKDQWSAAMRQLLLLSHQLLDRILGEWEMDVPEAYNRSALGSRGNEGTAMGFKALDAARIDSQNMAPLFKMFGGVWDALERLLTLEFDGPLPLPSHLIFSLISRLLSVDHSTVQLSFKTTPNSLLLFSHLAPLHKAAWSMLGLLVAVSGSQIFTISASINWLQKQQLRRLCAGSSAGRMAMEGCVRAKMYGAIRKNVEQQGITAVQSLSSDVAACFKLEFHQLLSHPKAAEKNIDACGPRRGTKRKGNKAIDFDMVSIDVEMAMGARPDNSSPAFSNAQYLSEAGPKMEAQKEIMGLFGAVLAAGGAWISGQERYQAEQAVQNVAERAIHCEALAMASIKLVLTLVLSSCGHRPRLLPLATKLLSEGRHHQSPSIRVFCCEATDYLGSFVHPRAAIPGTIDSIEGDEGKTRLEDVLAAPLPHMAPSEYAWGSNKRDSGALAQEQEPCAENGMATLQENIPEGSLVMKENTPDFRIPQVSASISAEDSKHVAHEPTTHIDNATISQAAPIGDLSPSGTAMPEENQTAVAPPIVAGGVEGAPQPGSHLFGSALSKMPSGIESLTQGEDAESGLVDESNVHKPGADEQGYGVIKTVALSCSDSEGPLPDIDSGESDED